MQKYFSSYQGPGRTRAAGDGEDEGEGEGGAAGPTAGLSLSLWKISDDPRLLQILSSCCDCDLIQHRPAQPRHDWTALLTN